MIASSPVARLYAYTGGDLNKAALELRRMNSERDRIVRENIGLEKRIGGAERLLFDEASIEYFCDLS